MRITACELPHEPKALATAWTALCQHTVQNSSDLVLLPEFAMVEPVWESERFDAAHWDAAAALSDAWLQRLGELRATHVVGTRPTTIDGRRFNEGYIWSIASGLTPLRRKFFLPTEPGNWETRWFERGDPAFPEFHAGELSFGLNICTELWALETYASYAAGNVQMIMTPRATGAATTPKWLSAGVVAAVPLRCLVCFVQPRRPDRCVWRRGLDHQPGRQDSGDHYGRRAIRNYRPRSIGRRCGAPDLPALCVQPRKMTGFATVPGEYRSRLLRPANRFRI